MATIYNYSPITGEFLSQAEARLDPIEQKPMLPAHATFEAPPETAQGEIAVYSASTWSVLDDHRGPWWSADGEQHYITELSAMRPEGALTTQPPVPGMIHDGTDWVDPPAYPDLAAAKVAIRAAIAAADQLVTDNVPTAERDTWPFQETAARAHLAGTADAVQTAMMNSLAVPGLETLDDLAGKIVAKADVYHTLAAALVGIRRRVDTALEAAPDETALEPIVDVALAEIQTLIGG